MINLTGWPLAPQEACNLVAQAIVRYEELPAGEHYKLTVMDPFGSFVVSYRKKFRWLRFFSRRRWVSVAGKVQDVVKKPEGGFNISVIVGGALANVDVPAA